VHKEGLQRFLRLSAASRIRVLTQAWSGDETWSEMHALLRQGSQPTLRLRRNLAQYDYKAADLYQEWHSGRQVVLRLLSLLPKSQWLSVDGLLKAIFDRHPRVLHATSDPSVWWLESPRTGRQFGTAFEDWQQSHGQFVLALLRGPLQWLGIVRLGYVDSDATTNSPSKEPRLAAFQLTEAGVYALGRRSELAEAQFLRSRSEGPSCSVSPDLTVSVVPDRTSLEMHNLLHSAGRLLDTTPDRFVYQLTAEGISRWLESSSAETTVESLIAFLSDHCQATDTRWCEKLRTWEQNRGLLHIYENITLIELADDYALQELLISTSLADHLVFQFSPRVVAIRADGVDALVQDMEKHGYTPRIK
jgi:hypothetical protein